MLVDDQGLLSLDEATSSVDALVADSTQDDFIVSAIPDIYDSRVSRSSTPSVPPGLSLPHAHPLLSAPDEVSAAKPISRILPTTAPFQPARSTPFVPRAVTPLANVLTASIATASQNNPNAPQDTSNTSTAQAKQDVKTLATNTGLSKAIASQSTQPSLTSEDFPALESGKSKLNTTAPATKNPSLTKQVVATSSNKKSGVPTGGSQVIQSTPKAVEKRVAASLNISVPSKSSAKTPVGPATPGKSTVPPSAFPPLPASTPSAQSPLTRKAPTTLRLTSTPKTETPTAGSATPSSVTSMFPPTFPPSRQPSLASVTRLDRPVTPTSEMLSDNASITSASMSRASSPPPSKIGSAPVRTTTKSMQRKQRKEIQREKEKAELEAAATMTEREPEIAPILGRKKKVKKDRTVHSAAGGSTPAVSRPSSPGPSEPIEAQKTKEETAELPALAEEKVVHPEPEPSARNNPKTQDSKGKGKAKIQPPPSPEPVSTAPNVEDPEPSRPFAMPAHILKELIEEGLIGKVDELAIFKNPPLSYRHPDPITDPNFNQKLTITAEDRATLLSGRPVHKVTSTPGRVMLTPNGDCVRNLTEEEEQMYLRLQAAIAKERGPTAFVSSRHTTGNGFALIEGRAVPNGPPSFFPIGYANNSTTPMDPVAKINRSEALEHINQFVLPSLSTSMQLEQALNSNTLDPEVMRSGASAAWTSWGTDPTAPHLENHEGSYGPGNHEGMIATGIERMTSHFAVSGDAARNQPNTVSLLSLPEAETAMQHARKDAEALEKRLNALIKKNRRIMLGSSH